MSFDPSSELIEDESNHLFLCYCTFINNIKGKKLSVQNVFVTTLEEPRFMGIFKEIMNLDTDFEVVKMFLDFDPGIAKSKYVTKFLNSKKRKKK